MPRLGGHGRPSFPSLPYFFYLFFLFCLFNSHIIRVMWSLLNILTEPGLYSAVGSRTQPHAKNYNFFPFSPFFVCLLKSVFKLFILCGPVLLHYLIDYLLPNKITIESLRADQIINIYSLAEYQIKYSSSTFFSNILKKINFNLQYSSNYNFIPLPPKK